jgi:hypothetical protein
MTAGPIERAFKFFNIASVICGGVADGFGVTGAANGGVFVGDAFGEAADSADGDVDLAGCSGSSCARSNEVVKIKTRTNRFMADHCSGGL